MVLLGLLLMLGCAAVAVDAVVQNAAAVHAILFNQPITGLTLGGVFVAGAVLGVLFALGLAMFVGGLGRAARVRRERRVLRDNATETEALRARNEEMERRLATRRDTTASGNGYAAPAYPDETTTTGEPVEADSSLRGRHRA